MKTLIFKLFCRNFILLLLLLVTILAFGCNGRITGNSIIEESGRPIEAYFCPEDNCGKILENEIRNSNVSAHCAFYDLDLRNVIDALSKKSRSADVRIVIDSTNNDGQIKGSSVKFDDNNQLMHNKFCVIDKSIVITGSFNPTDNDNNFNNNNAIIIESKFLAENYEDEFDELWNGKFGEGNEVKYPKLSLNGVSVENYFCPEDCQLELSSTKDKDSGLYKIIDLIRNAEESVKVASFTFTHESIADELIKADARGVNATIITETRQRNVMGSQYQRVKGFGLNIKLDGNKYNMHHKFIIIDGKIVITGSPNYTLGGFNKNDENFLIIYDENLALKYVGEFDGLYDEGDLPSKN